jgi:hypothetical protein
MSMYKVGLLAGDRLLDFNVGYARVYGRSEAIVLSLIQEECKNNPVPHNGMSWCVLTYDRIAIEAACSAGTAKRAVQHLVKEGILVVGCFNEDKFDRTRWYRLSQKVGK